MGVFGRDEVAEHVIATLDELQVEHSRCRQYEGENGYARVTLVDGDRGFSRKQQRRRIKRKSVKSGRGRSGVY